MSQLINQNFLKAINSAINQAAADPYKTPLVLVTNNRIKSTLRDHLASWAQEPQTFVMPKIVNVTSLQDLLGLSDNLNLESLRHTKKQNLIHFFHREISQNFPNYSALQGLNLAKAITDLMREFEFSGVNFEALLALDTESFPEHLRVSTHLAQTLLCNPEINALISSTKLLENLYPRILSSLELAAQEREILIYVDYVHQKALEDFVKALEHSPNVKIFESPWRKTCEEDRATSAAISPKTFHTPEEETRFVVDTCLQEISQGKRVGIIAPSMDSKLRLMLALSIYNIRADLPGGTPLYFMPSAQFCALLSQVLGEPEPTLDLWLALLKHPLLESHGLENRFKHLEWIRGIEKKCRIYGDFKTHEIESSAYLTPLFEAKQKKNLTLNQCFETLISLLNYFVQPEGENFDHKKFYLEVTLGYLKDALQNPHLKNIPSTWPSFSDYFLCFLKGADNIPQITLSTAFVQILDLKEAPYADAETFILFDMNKSSWDKDLKGAFLGGRIMEKLGLNRVSQEQTLKRNMTLNLVGAKPCWITRSQQKNGSLTEESVLWTLIQDTQEIIQRADVLTYTPLPSQRYKPPYPKATKPPSYTIKSLTISQIETLLNDPYTYYCQQILGLRPWTYEEEYLPARDRGIIIHKCLENYVNREIYRQDDFKAFKKEQQKLFFEKDAGTNLLWWPRAEETLEYLHNYLRSNPPEAIRAEESIRYVLNQTEISGRLDRVDETLGDSFIIDYKTGELPREAKIKKGEKPQLALQLWLVLNNGWPKVYGQFWKILGKEGDGVEKGALLTLSPEDRQNITHSLENLLEYYQNPQALFIPALQENVTAKDFNHIKRYEEWA